MPSLTSTKRFERTSSASRTGPQHEITMRSRRLAQLARRPGGQAASSTCPRAQVYGVGCAEVRSSTGDQPDKPARILCRVQGRVAVEAIVSKMAGRRLEPLLSWQRRPRLWAPRPASARHRYSKTSAALEGRPSRSNSCRMARPAPLVHAPRIDVPGGYNLCVHATDDNVAGRSSTCRPRASRTTA